MDFATFSGMSGMVSGMGRAGRPGERLGLGDFWCGISLIVQALGYCA